MVWVSEEPGGGAAGSIYYKLDLTNLSGRACTLRGYPGVSAVDLAGRRIGRSASREAGSRGALITLRPQQTAWSVLRITAAGNFPAASCHQVMAAGLRVYPPGQRRSRIVPFPFAACSSSAVGVLSVRAVERIAS